MTLTISKELQRKYSTAISKGAGMIDETRRLLDQWHPEETLDDFTRRVQEEGLLGNSTAYRTRDLVRRVFAPRFLSPTISLREFSRWFWHRDCRDEFYTELLFLFAARQDPLVYDFTVREYWPAVRRGRSIMDTDLMLSFLSEAHFDGRLDKQWSEKVSVRVARSVLGLLRDVGFLREVVRGRREIVNYRMSDEGAAILARNSMQQA
jgi:hypothetical protein